MDPLCAYGSPDAAGPVYLSLLLEYIYIEHHVLRIHEIIIDTYQKITNKLFTKDRLALPIFSRDTFSPPCSTEDILVPTFTPSDTRRLISRYPARIRGNA
jgi:hypothetical protein